jgi:hypothetical protein
MEHLGLESLTDFDAILGPNKYTFQSSFQSFPLEQGWKLDPSSGDLTPEPSRASDKLGDLFRSWLFFGLIAAVVYDDGKVVCPSGEFNANDFLVDHKQDAKRLSTLTLPKILEIWQQWEVSQKGTTEQKMRMIRAQLALDLARRVIIRNCSFENPRVRGKIKDLKLVDKNQKHVSSNRWASMCEDGMAIQISAGGHLKQSSMRWTRMAGALERLNY